MSIRRTLALSGSRITARRGTRGRRGRGARHAVQDDRVPRGGAVHRRPDRHRARPRRLRRQVRRTQHLNLELFPSQAAKLEAKGFELQAADAPKLGPKAARATGGDSPNPYYDVFRSYSEPGGIADELRGLARDNPDVVKLVEIGKSLLGKPILTIKITNNARNTPDGTRPRCSTAPPTTPASGSRPRSSAARRTGSSTTRTTRASSGSSPRPSCGSCPSRTRTATTTRSPAARAPPCKVCGPGEANSNRLWRKTLRDNNNNGIYGDSDRRRRPQPQLPRAVGAGRGGLQREPLQRRLPRPVRELRARELRL